MGPIPAFEADGLLPPGDYEVSFDELRQSHPGGRAGRRGDVADLGFRVAGETRRQPGDPDAAALAGWDHARFLRMDRLRRTRTIRTTSTGISSAALDR